VNGRLTLEEFRGIVFVGGFSYADMLDSGKGWAGVIKFNNNVFQQFEAFRKRKDTFSLGVCNGCQLMALLGWIPTSEGLPEEQQPRLLENDSGRFESRFSSVKILESPAVMFKVCLFHDTAGIILVKTTHKGTPCVFSHFRAWRDPP